MDESQQLIVLIVTVGVISVHLTNYLLNANRPSRRWWVRPINRFRRQQGHYHNLFKYMKEHDQEEFFEFTRMSPQKFDELVNLVDPFLRKNSIRKSLPTELRLALTLSYLAHGSSVRSTSWDFRIGRSTAYKIITEVCTAIWRALQPTYLTAMNSERWANVAQGFEEKWQFPNCLGAVDGKHIRIQAPRHSGSDYFNYKKFFSIVLMASCDANYRFIWVDIGQYGKSILSCMMLMLCTISYVYLWSRSMFGTLLDQGVIDLPLLKNLPQSNITTHYTFVADEAFPLKNFLLRPYSRNDLGDAERVFNYRLSRARRVIENTFGILMSRWRLLTRTMCCTPDNAICIVQAMVCLHNFIMSAETDHAMPQARLYCPPHFIDYDTDEHDVVEGQWRALVNEGQLENFTQLIMLLGVLRYNVMYYVIILYQ